MEWLSEWFYAGTMLPTLAVHSDSGPSVNDCWEKNPLSSEVLKKIQPLLERIRKQQGLTGFGMVASYLRRRVQPLKAKENYDFEYSGVEDPSRMVPALELTEEEVLEHLKKFLKGVSIVPHTDSEHHADNLPPAMTFFLLCKYFSSHFLYYCYFLSSFPLLLLLLLVISRT
jgi:hypothetical protein